MPKIIKNLRENLLLETKKQLFAYGMSGVTIRSVSNNCGIGIGTVYNYFSSKEMMIGSAILEDWKVYLAKINELPKDNPQVLFEGIYNALISFAKDYAPVFTQESGLKEKMSDFPKRHKMLRSQLAEILLPLCQKAGMENPAFGAEFITESLISWAMEGVPFAQMYPLLAKLVEA